MTEFTRRGVLKFTGAGTISTSVLVQSTDAETNVPDDSRFKHGGTFRLQNTTDTEATVEVGFTPIPAGDKKPDVAQFERIVPPGSTVELPSLGIPTNRYQIEATANGETTTVDWGIPKRGLPKGKKITVRVLPDRIKTYCADS